MRHRKKGKKLNRNIKQRQALFKGLIKSLILNQEIKTSQAKAKAIKPIVDKLITKAKAGSLDNRRQVLAFLSDKKAVNHLFDVIAPHVSKPKTADKKQPVSKTAPTEKIAKPVKQKTTKGFFARKLKQIIPQKRMP